MNTLILSSSNRNFPLDLLGVLESAGIPCARLGSLPEFISSPLRSRPFFAVLEVGNKEDIDRALIAYEWAQKVQPQAPARFLLLVGSKHISLSEKAFRFGGVEIAQLPLPNKNLLFKIDLQIKLLEKEASRPPRDADGFFAEFTGPTKERVLVMRGPRKGSWESESPHGKVRWRWVRADAPKKEELTWTVQSREAPVYDEKENLWKVKEPGAQLSCRKEEEVLFLAQDEGVAVSGEESPKEERAAPVKEPEGMESPVEVKGAGGPVKEPDSPVTEAAVPENTPAPSRAESRRPEHASSEPLAAAKPELFSAPPGGRGSVSRPQSWSADGPEEKVTEKPDHKADSFSLTAPGKDSRAKESQDRKTSPTKSVSISEPEGGTSPVSANVSSSLPVGHLVERETKPSASSNETTPGIRTQSSSGESVGSLRSLLGREEERVSSVNVSPEPKPGQVSSGTKGLGEEVSPVGSPPGREANPLPQEPSGRAALQKETKEQSPAREKPSPSEEVKSIQEKDRSVTDDPVPARARHIKDSPPQPTSESGSGQPSLPEGEAQRRESPTPPPQSTLDSGFSPQEMESRISGENARAPSASTTGGESRADGRIEVHLRSTPAPSEETKVNSTSGGAEDPEHFLKMRHFLTLSLEELHDRNSSWYPVEGYRIYLSAQHRYYGFQAVEEVLPLWIYEGELAPEFLDLKKAWKFYDRRPVLYGSKAELPPAVLAYLMKSAGEKAAAVGEAAPSTNEAPRESSAEAGLGRPEEAEERAPSKPPAEPEEEGNLFVRLVRKVFGKD